MGGESLLDVKQFGGLTSIFIKELKKKSKKVVLYAHFNIDIMLDGS